MIIFHGEICIETYKEIESRNKTADSSLTEKTAHSSSTEKTADSSSTEKTPDSSSSRDKTADSSSSKKEIAASLSTIILSKLKENFSIDRFDLTIVCHPSNDTFDEQKEEIENKFIENFIDILKEKKVLITSDSLEYPALKLLLKSIKKYEENGGCPVPIVIYNPKENDEGNVNYLSIVDDLKREMENDVIHLIFDENDDNLLKIQNCLEKRQDVIWLNNKNKHRLANKVTKNTEWLRIADEKRDDFLKIIIFNIINKKKIFGRKSYLSDIGVNCMVKNFPNFNMKPNFIIQLPYSTLSDDNIQQIKHHLTENASLFLTDGKPNRLLAKATNDNKSIWCGFVKGEHNTIKNKDSVSQETLKGAGLDLNHQYFYFLGEDEDEMETKEAFIKHVQTQHEKVIDVLINFEGNSNDEVIQRLKSKKYIISPTEIKDEKMNEECKKYLKTFKKEENGLKDCLQEIYEENYPSLFIDEQDNETVKNTLKERKDILKGKHLFITFNNNDEHDNFDNQFMRIFEKKFNVVVKVFKPLILIDGCSKLLGPCKKATQEKKIKLYSTEPSCLEHSSKEECPNHKEKYDHYKSLKKSFLPKAILQKQIIQAEDKIPDFYLISILIVIGGEIYKTLQEICNILTVKNDRIDKKPNVFIIRKCGKTSLFLYRFISIIKSEKAESEISDLWKKKIKNLTMTKKVDECFELCKTISKYKDQIHIVNLYKEDLKTAIEDAYFNKLNDDDQFELAIRWGITHRQFKEDFDPYIEKEKFQNYQEFFTDSLKSDNKRVVEIVHSIFPDVTKTFYPDELFTLSLNNVKGFKFIQNLEKKPIVVLEKLNGEGKSIKDYNLRLEEFNKKQSCEGAEKLLSILNNEAFNKNKEAQDHKKKLNNFKEEFKNAVLNLFNEHFDKNSSVYSSLENKLLDGDDITFIFAWSIIANKTKVSEYFWLKSNNPLKLAIFAFGILKRARKEAIKEYDTFLATSLLERKQVWKDKALRYLNDACENDKNIIDKKVKEEAKQRPNSIDSARAVRFKEYIASAFGQWYLNELWQGNLGNGTNFSPRVKFWIALVSMIFN
ncbi:unnamed protein product [Dimorphilus gyrociliatus]|uniref:Uncharacterized protein n=1 Tax=Dimorphilus gyrociliatus TaxID=2664684 RepID=A0A7I8VCT5_9ANNE|nr:unnamed protein product [Dimorphilus gyrociliatus]